MSAASRVLYLRIALIVIGLIFIFGIYPLSIIWPSGWAWGEGHSHYLMMIIGIYATLGVFLLMASRDPDAPANNPYIAGPDLVSWVTNLAMHTELKTRHLSLTLPR